MKKLALLLLALISTNGFTCTSDLGPTYTCTPAGEESFVMELSYNPSTKEVSFYGDKYKLRVINYGTTMIDFFTTAETETTFQCLGVTEGKGETLNYRIKETFDSTDVYEQVYTADSNFYISGENLIVEETSEVLEYKYKLENGNRVGRPVEVIVRRPKSTFSYTCKKN